MNSSLKFDTPAYPLLCARLPWITTFAHSSQVARSWADKLDYKPKIKIMPPVRIVVFLALTAATTEVVQAQLFARSAHEGILDAAGHVNFRYGKIDRHIVSSER